MQLNRYLCITILLFTALTIISGCSSFRRIDQSKEELLLAHLESWDNFNLQGLVELSYGQLRMRKNILIKMNREYLDLMVYDSGIFGLRPKPFLSARIDTTLTLELPEVVTSMLDEQPIPANITIDSIYNLFSMLHRHRNAIVRSGFIDFSRTGLIFNDLMQIERIVIKNPQKRRSGEVETVSIALEYGRDNTVAKIDFYHNTTILMTITADRART